MVIMYGGFYSMALDIARSQLQISHSVCEELNPIFKRVQQTFAVCQPNFLPDFSLFFVVDGHENDRAAKMFSSYFESLLATNLKNIDSNVERAINETVGQIEDRLRYLDGRNTVVSLSALLFDSNRASYYVITIGNCNAARFDRLKAFQGEMLSAPQNSGVSSFAKNSFWDSDTLDKNQLIEPKISEFEVGSHDILIATSGLWQFSSLKGNAASLAKDSGKSLTSKCRNLVDIALENGCQENISAILLSFHR